MLRKLLIIAWVLFCVLTPGRAGALENGKADEPPDLTIQQIDPDASLPGQAVTVTVTIKNQGLGDSGTSLTRIRLDGATVCFVTADPIVSGATTQVTCPVGVLACGTHQVDACADIDNQIVESDETNNCKVEPVSVEAPDLIVLRIDPDQAIIGEAVTVTVTLYNQGTLAAGPTKTRVKVDGTDSCAQIDTPSIPSGQTAQVQCAIGSYALGTTLQVEACTDVTGLLNECSEANNCLTEPVTIRDLPNLIVTGITPDVAPLGEAVTVTVTVANTGTKESAVSKTQVKLNNAVKCNAIDTAAIPAGGSKQVTCNIGSLLCNPYGVTACADATNLVAELTETDNCLTEAVTGIGPDLIVERITPTTGIPHTAITVTVTVRNQGGVDAGATSTRISVNDTVICDAVTTPAIPHGQAADVTCNIGSYDEGLIQVEACADGASEVAECSDANNCATQGVTLGPDVLVELVELDTASPDPKIKVTVRNQGNTTAGFSKTQVKVDGVVLCAEIPTLPISVGGTVQVTCSAASLTCEPHEVEACADIADIVPESNEENNCTTRSVNMIGPDLAVQRIALDETAPDTTAILDIEIVNAGTVDAAASVTDVRAEGELRCEAIPTPAIAAGGTARLQCEIGRYPESMVEIQVCADASHLVPECDEENNCRTEDVTAVLLSAFGAEYGEDGVSLTWEVTEDATVIGFNVYRRSPGELHFARLNDEVLPAHPDRTAYTFLDRDVAAGATYTYLLKGITGNGSEDPVGSLTIMTGQGRSRFGFDASIPEPFSSEVAIGYSIPGRGHARLELFDSTGRKVRTLIDRSEGGGPHTILWRGDDETGVVLPGGVYFARLSYGSNLAARRITFLR